MNDKWVDRHAPVAPDGGTGGRSDNTVQWASWLKSAQQRVGELFLTERGLNGHLIQVQGELNRLSKAIKDGKLTLEEGLLLFASLGADMVRSAGRAKFDFEDVGIQLPRQGYEFHVCRYGGNAGVLWHNLPK